MAAEADFSPWEAVQISGIFLLGLHWVHWIACNRLSTGARTGRGKVEVGTKK